MTAPMTPPPWQEIEGRLLHTVASQSYRAAEAAPRRRLLRRRLLNPPAAPHNRKGWAAGGAL